MPKTAEAIQLIIPINKYGIKNSKAKLPIKISVKKIGAGNILYKNFMCFSPISWLI